MSWCVDVGTILQLRLPPYFSSKRIKSVSCFITWCFLRAVSFPLLLVLNCRVRLRGTAYRYERHFTLLEAKQVQGLIIRGSDEICAVMSPNTPPPPAPFLPRLDSRIVPVINSEVTSDRNPEYCRCLESGMESARTHNVTSYPT